MLRILLIDDDTQITGLLDNFLVREGHTVFTACNGKEGLKLVDTVTFDLVITDIIMPEQDGLGVLMSLKNRPIRPKIIAMSGGSTSLDQEHLLDMAKLIIADVVINKPIQLSYLSVIINGM
ncbi:MAG TPA: response regulator [Desulfuromonadales bacterium]|nr:response regulator [Desulfuromonadales bacterium]